MKTKMTKTICCVLMAAVVLVGTAFGTGHGRKQVSPQCIESDVLVLQ